MIVIDNVGKVKDEEKSLEFLNKRLYRSDYMSLFELEDILKRSTTVTFFDKDGRITCNIEEALMKVIDLDGVIPIGHKVPISISFIKSEQAAGRWGHASDEAWVGFYSGMSDELYTNWLKYKENYDNIIMNKESTGQGSIGKILSRPDMQDKLNDLELNNDIKAIPVEKSNSVIFLEYVYDLLYMKESWKDNEGKLHRLNNYFTHLAVKIYQDNQTSKYMKFNKQRNLVIFNSRLLNKYGNYIIICCKIDRGYFHEYKVIDNTTELNNMGFELSAMDVEPISFFHHMDEVVFQGTIDDFETRSMDRLVHIIVERKDRLPKYMHNMGELDINMRIMSSVGMALKIAQTDYKFIVPMYNKDTKRIQFLLPVYSSFNGESKPECALVVERNIHGKWEIRTVLDLEMAYMNARLINRPDQSWLNIDDMSANVTPSVKEGVI